MLSVFYSFSVSMTACLSVSLSVSLLPVDMLQHGDLGKGAQHKNGGWRVMERGEEQEQTKIRKGRMGGNKTGKDKPKALRPQTQVCQP